MMAVMFKRLLKIGFLLLTNSAFASSFQLWEQNVTNIENFHAGRAVLASDASTNYDNPAGITRIKNQQVVAGGASILTDVNYTGNVDFCLITICTPYSQGRVQGGSFTLIPNFHYVAPLGPLSAVGISVVSPYGSDVEYGQNSFVATVTTRARLAVVDIAPSLGFNLTNKLSLGLGFDIEKMSAEFNTILMNSLVVNKGYDTAYGFHSGALYQLTESTRLGLAYHSKVVHHLKGTSHWMGGLSIPGNPNSTRALFNIPLPPDTTLSLYHRFDPRWAMMGTVVYTQWKVINHMVLQNMAGVFGVPVDYVMNFHNTMNLSLGVDYRVSDQLTLRAGGGYDQSPTRNAYRILQLPDTDRYALAVGGHYQFTKALGFDLGWTHLFLQDGVIHPPLQKNLSAQYIPRGYVKSSADVVGAQLLWNFI